MSRESLCVLASLNVGKFSTTPEIYVGQLERIGVSMNRFLDNVNECELVYETFATPHQRLAIQKLRRTGAGVTNIVGWLFKKKLAYATPEANDAFEEFIKLFNYWLYYSSECGGKEKDNFGLFDKEKWKSSPFIKSKICGSLSYLHVIFNLWEVHLPPIGWVSQNFLTSALMLSIKGHR